MSSTAFGAPFDHDDADAILRSSDQVDFRVYRVLLSTFSPFFKSMFTLPQPDATSISKKQNPVVDLPENSRTIAALLSFIYPVDSVAASPESLDDMINTLAAAKKYDMAVVSQHLIPKFARSKVVQDNPVVAFYAAYSHELGEAARVAAKASLEHRMNLDNIADKSESQFLNGAAFHQLYKYHRACSAAAAGAVSSSDLSWITTSPHQISSWQNLANVECSQPSKCPPRHQYIIKRPSGQSRSNWEYRNTGRHWDATTPYYNYITRVHNVLLEHPCREAVTNHDFLEPFYKEETGCQTCRLAVLGLPEFSRVLGEEVERRISEVDLELPF